MLRYGERILTPTLLQPAQGWVKDRRSFTLIELLIVMGILGALAGAVVLVLNPAELLRRTRDATRMEDLATLNRALGLFQADRIGAFTGTSSVVYVSLPDTTSTCANLSLPSPPQGWSYFCASPATYRNVDGTGWVPVAFTQFSSGSPLSKLPIDPVNATSTGEYYTYVTGGSWHLTAFLASDKYRMGGSTDRASRDSGSYPELYELGSNLTLLPVSRDPSLVGYWTFDEGTGTTAYDASGKGNTGTWNGSGSRWATGKVGSYAGQFNGNSTQNYVILTASTAFIDVLKGSNSVLLWYNYSSDITQNANLFLFDASNTMEGRHRAAISTSTPNNIMYDYSGSDNVIKNKTFSTSPNVWHHLAVMVDAAGLVATLYQDGVSAGTLSLSTKWSGTATAGRLGFGYLTTHYLNGYLDDVRFYNRTLSAAEIQAIYNAAQ